MLIIIIDLNDFEMNIIIWFIFVCFVVVEGGDMESSDEDSMGFDDDDNGSDLLSNTTLGDDITAQLAAAGKTIQSNQIIK